MLTTLKTARREWTASPDPGLSGQCARATVVRAATSGGCRRGPDRCCNPLHPTARSAPTSAAHSGVNWRTGGAVTTTATAAKDIATGSGSTNESEARSGSGAETSGAGAETGGGRVVDGAGAETSERGKCVADDCVGTALVGRETSVVGKIATRRVVPVASATTRLSLVF